MCIHENKKTTTHQADRCTCICRCIVDIDVDDIDINVDIDVEADRDRERKTQRERYSSHPYVWCASSLISSLLPETRSLRVLHRILAMASTALFWQRALMWFLQSVGAILPV